MNAKDSNIDELHLCEVLESASQSSLAWGYFVKRKCGKSDFTKEQKEAFETLPNWAKNTIKKQVETYHWPWIEAAERAKEKADTEQKFDPKSFGVLSGNLQRLSRLFHTEIPEGKGKIGREVSEMINSMPEALRLITEKAKDELDLNHPDDKELFESLQSINTQDFISSVHQQLKTFGKNLYSAVPVTKECIQFNSEETEDIAAFEERQSYGFNSTLKQSGELTHDGGTSELLNLLLISWKSIESLRTKESELTAQAIKNLLIQFHGKEAIIWPVDHLREIFREIGLKTKGRGRPKKK